MGYLLDAFLKSYDTIHHGWTPHGIAFGICATVGRGWAVPGDTGQEAVAAVGLYRGTPKESDIDFDRPVGVALGKATSIQNSTWQGHDADTCYVYAARPFNGAGIVADSTFQPQRLLADGAGEIIYPPVPNEPSYVNAVTLPAGKATIQVGYARQGEGVEPTDLQVYGMSVADPIVPISTTIFHWGNLLTDDVTGLTEIPFRSGVAKYKFNLQAQTDGEFWIFAAAFRNSTGIKAISAKRSNVITIDETGPALLNVFYV